MKKSLFLLVLFLVATSCVFSIPLNQLHIEASDGTYLGTFENEYSGKSVYNHNGIYGSPNSARSIMNKNSNYGSNNSPLSPFNPNGSNGPWLVDRYGNIYGRLSVNKYASGVTNESYRIALQLKALRDSY